MVGLSSHLSHNPALTWPQQVPVTLSWIPWIPGPCLGTTCGLLYRPGPGGPELTKRKGNGDRESSILWVTWKTNKTHAQDLYRSRRHSVSSQGDQKPRWESELSRLPCSEELAMENEKEPQLPGFWHQKWKVRDLEKGRFWKRTRPELYRNRSSLMRWEGAAVRLVSCYTNPRKKYI